MVTFDTAYVADSGRGIAMGKAFDDRAGVHPALSALSLRWGFPLRPAFPAQKEVGLRGAAVAARRVRPTSPWSSRRHRRQTPRGRPQSAP